MRHLLSLSIALLTFANFGYAQCAPAPAAQPAPPQLTGQQLFDSSLIISTAKSRGKGLEEQLAKAAKQFDEVLLGETADVAADRRAAQDIQNIVAQAADIRLEAAREVVHLLSPEQRSYLKAEMAKPGSERGILEAFAKVFHLEVAK